jgi:hypothetical protein
MCKVKETLTIRNTSRGHVNFSIFGRAKAKHIQASHVVFEVVQKMLVLMKEKGSAPRRSIYTAYS